MGRIAIEATIDAHGSPHAAIVCEALVDTGAAYLTLPNAWRSRLGDLATLDTAWRTSPPRRCLLLFTIR